MSIFQRMEYKNALILVLICEIVAHSPLGEDEFRLGGVAAATELGARLMVLDMSGKVQADS